MLPSQVAVLAPSLIPPETSSLAAGLVVPIPTFPATVLATIIHGGDAGSVITCDSGEGPATVLSGFLITNGSAEFGGGMGNSGSSPTVINCAFSENSAERGGGIKNSESNPTVINCTFSGNTASCDGGGVFNTTSSNPTVNQSVICRNTPDQVFGAFTDGGGNAISDDHCVPLPSEAPPGNLDGDGDVDLIDFGILQSLLTGPLLP